MASNSKFAESNKFSNKQNVPKFFNVIINPLEQGLMVPRAYMVKHGDTIKKSMSLKVRSGALWPVQLVRKESETWLQNGWEEFGEYYSIEMSQPLVFNYVGNSVFNVMIYDITGVELDYACYHRKNGDVNSNCRRRINRKLHKTGDDSEDEIMEAPKIQVCKRKEQMEPEVEDTQSNDNQRTRVQSIKNNRGKSFDETNRHSKATICRRPSGIDREQFQSYQRAKAFKSKNPFFIRFMQPSYVCRSPVLICPLSFFKNYITTKYDMKFNIVVLDPLGRKWEVTCTLRQKNACWTGHGWRDIVSENCLKFADVCVFELVGPKFFNLRIYRRLDIEELDAAEVSHPYNITGHGRDENLCCRKMKRTLHEIVNDMEDVGKDNSVEILEPEVQVIQKDKLNKLESDDALEVDRISTVILDGISDPKRGKHGTENSEIKYLNNCNCRVKNAKMRKLDEDVNQHNTTLEESWENTGRCSNFSIPKNFTTMDKEQFTSYQRAKTFKSKKPFFISFMQPSYVSGNRYLNIPLPFAKRYIFSKQVGKCSIVICDPLGRRREVTCLVYPGDAKWTGLGWRELVQENNLKVADVCVFELVADKVFNVIIYRNG